MSLNELGDAFVLAIASRELTVPLKNVPELAHAGVNSRFVNLMWRNYAMDPIACFSIHQVRLRFASFEQIEDGGFGI